jgi:formamidopyrimidine-DNA glycosylase
MPELPEVETVRRGLASHAEGKRISRVTIRNRHLRQRIPDDFAAALTGLTILESARRAKYLLLHCNGGITLIIHLGMSGSLVIHRKPPKHYAKHDHVILHLSDGSVIAYHDPRRFGLMICCNTDRLEHHKLFVHLGPEPLAASWKPSDLYNALHRRKAPVKSVIMDQTVVVGVGNIYACEALFVAGIRPTRPAAHITKTEAAALAKAIRSVLRAAIASGGSTLRDYVRSSGEAGYFQHHFNVYGRQNLPCQRCNTPIAVLRQSGRSTFFCSACQK